MAVTAGTMSITPSTTQPSAPRTTAVGGLNIVTVNTYVAPTTGQLWPRITQR